jgi:flagellar hook-associated protein 1 FlgK
MADAKTVMELREKTGAGVMDCKAALQASNGNLDAAVEYLRKKGLADAKKREHREAKDGLVHAYIHPGGKLGALIDVSKTGGIVDQYRAQLNTVVKTLADDVNAIHTAGGGAAFFSYGAAGTEAGTLAVNVTATTMRTSTTGAVGANDIALAIAGLRGGTPDKLYTAFVTRIGGDLKNAQRGESNANVLLNSIEDRRQSTSGVSMDEEMTNLVRFQRGYQASARTMSTMDQMLDTLINRTGVVGL